MSGVSVADGGFEGEGGFLGLRVSGWCCREAGEIVQAEASAPDFGAELMEGLLGREASRRGGVHPLGAWQDSVGGGRTSEGAFGRQEEQGVGSDAEGRSGFDGMGTADLSLAQAQQSFLFTEIDFDAPALEVGLDEDRRIELFVRGEEKGGMAIEQLGTLAQAISERGDDDQLQDSIRARGTPH